MDKIDKKLITLLQNNARMPLKALAENVFLSSPAVSARIERLEKEEKDKLSEILNEFYKDKYKIYERLKDNVSLNYILEEKIQKLTEIGGRILG